MYSHREIRCRGWWFAVCLLLLSGILYAGESAAQEPSGIAEVKESLQVNMNVIWTCIAAFLVFFMQAGFAMVETGFTRAKNSVNILMKNLMDFAVGSLVFFLIGFGLMFGRSNGLFGTTMFALGGVEPGEDWSWTFLIFQTVFAATAATIVSGAMAERTKFISYLIYSAVISLVIYPVFGSWAWGNLLLTDNTSWLANMGFHDFAGSTVVHSIGGWLALAGAVLLGPRLGKYGRDGKPKALLGHNIPLAALGVFILWFGWFGFNPGSTTVAGGKVGYIAVTTNLAAAAGAVSSLLTSWMVLKKPDLSMTLNGTLAGLVAITAPCDGVTPIGAIVIGLVAGVLVVFSVLFFDAVLKIDDPVGAVSVHAVNGFWGTVAYGLFAVDGGIFYGGGLRLLGIQLLGAGVAFVWAFGLGLLLFWVLRNTVGLRVSTEEEMKGLDIGEHGMEAYSGFQIFSIM